MSLRAGQFAAGAQGDEEAQSFTAVSVCQHVRLPGCEIQSRVAGRSPWMGFSTTTRPVLVAIAQLTARTASTPAWSDGHSPDSVRSAGLLPISVSETAAILPRTSTRSMRWVGVVVAL